MAVGAMKAFLQLHRLTATAKGPERVTILREGCFFGFFPPQALRASKKIKTKNLHISKKSSTFAREFEKTLATLQPNLQNMMVS